MSDIVLDIRNDLRKHSNEETRKSGQHFFKETIKMYGVKTPIVGTIGKEYFSKIRDKENAEIFSLCEILWQSGLIEESFIACNWSFYVHKLYKPDDLKIFERWLTLYVNNWASCDTLCNHTIGTLIEMYPDLLSTLKKWALAKNRWLRRAAAVSLILPAKKGKFLGDIFEIADILLMDADDLVQKGYGWMLKAASQSAQKQVFDYVVKHKTTMPRTALRYAIEKMPQSLRYAAMAK